MSWSWGGTWRRWLTEPHIIVKALICLGEGWPHQDINDGWVCPVCKDGEKNQQTHWKVESVLQCKISSGTVSELCKRDTWCTSKENLYYGINDYTQASKASWAFTLSMHACLGWPPKNSLSNCVEIWIWYKYIFVQAWAWWWQCGLGAASQSCFCLKPGSHPSHGNRVESHSPSNGPIMLSQSTAIFIQGDFT